MSIIRKIIPCIYLYQGKAVKGISDHFVLKDDPLELVEEFNKLGVNEIFLYDLSEGQSDSEHEKALDIIKEICKKADASVIGTGNIKRMEDVKKLLYAGCSKIALNYSIRANIEVTKEVSEKFGKSKIFVLVNT